MTKTAVAKTKKPSTAAKIAGVDASTLKELVKVFKSLADEYRLQILLILAKHGNLHVKAICDELHQSQPAVSHHLKELKNAGLVDSDRDGKFNYYKLESTRLAHILSEFFPTSSSVQQKVAFGDLEVTFKIK